MVKVISLESLEKNRFEELATLDKYFFTKYGNSFSDEFWTKENFEYPLPSKYRLSFVILINDIIKGYCISSIKNDSIYIHRFGVLCEVRQSDYFLNEILKEYRDKKIYLMVNVKNRPAISFYQKHEFNVVDKIDEIKPFIASSLEIQENKIVINEGYECFLMRKV